MDLKRPWLQTRRFQAGRADSAVSMRSRKMDTRGRKKWDRLDPRTRRLLVAASVIESVLKIAALIDLARRPSNEVRGPKTVWAAVVSLVNSFGAVPIAYFAFGRVKPPHEGGNEIGIDWQSSPFPRRLARTHHRPGHQAGRQVFGDHDEGRGRETQALRALYLQPPEQARQLRSKCPASAAQAAGISSTAIAARNSGPEPHELAISCRTHDGDVLASALCERQAC